MRTQHLFPQEQRSLDRLSVHVLEKAEHPLAQFVRQAPVGILLIIALLAFEVFNFDTTRYALLNLMGDISVVGLRWATVLALAFCAIDFAGLAHLFAPGRLGEVSGETWYLMGAWILGATMNAVMTWWAVSLTLLNHELGNELLSRQQLLEIVPPFVAVLVWVTRILFIGAFSVVGARVFEMADGAAAEELRFEEDGDEAIYVDLPFESRPLRESSRAIPSYSASAFRPIERGPRSLNARGRNRR